MLQLLHDHMASIAVACIFCNGGWCFIAIKEGRFGWATFYAAIGLLAGAWFT